MREKLLYSVFAAMLGLTGCSKYLDKEPDNRTTIKTPEQVSQLLTTAYPHGNYIPFCEAMSDNAEDKGGGGSGYDNEDQVNRQSYYYEVVEIAPDLDDGPDYYWFSCYKAIAAANQAMEIVVNFANPASLSAQKGEALVARAYAHFMLVALYAKTYDPATAASDPGIPYVTAPEKEVFLQYERKTVAYVYEMIERDLLEGISMIDDKSYGASPKFHFNRKAAAAFATRFYMFKGDYANAVIYANRALENPAASNLRPWNTTLTELQYAQLKAEYTKSSLEGNLLLQEAVSLWGRSYPSVRYGLGTNVANSVLRRVNVSGSTYAYDLYGANPQSYNIPKFYEHFVTETLNANSGQAYNTIPLFTAEEALLNRAEAYTRLGNPSAAINDLNAFISKNIDQYQASSDNVTVQKIVDYYQLPTAESIIRAALDFKRAFFLHEGLRWLDILRLHIPVTHATKEGIEITLTENDNRRILQLPVLTKQAGLAQNER